MQKSEINLRVLDSREGTRVGNRTEILALRGRSLVRFTEHKGSGRHYFVGGGFIPRLIDKEITDGQKTNSDS